MKKFLKIFSITILITGIFITKPCFAKNFTSKFNFKFNLSEGYKIFNNLNLYDVYNSSHKDPLIKAKIKMFKEKLKTQDIELLYNFSSHPLNNISILVFNEKSRHF